MDDNHGKAAIFDLDGTLLDSMGVWDQVDIDFLAKRGIEVPADYMGKVAAMQFRQIAEYTIARFGLPDTPEALMQEWDDMARVACSTVVEAKPHAVEYLSYLKRSGAKLAVATSLPPALREPAMKHVGIFDYFDQIVSVDDANDVGKDRPDVFLWPPAVWAWCRSSARCSRICWWRCGPPSPSACGYGRSMMILLTGTGRISAVSPMACCLISARLRAVCEPTRNCYALDLDSCP